MKDNVLSFKLPFGYNKKLPLIIDPVLVFASYSGSTSDNFGFTATYDLEGHLYGAGIVFDDLTGYPTTTGAYQLSLEGGRIDVGITKFSPDGTSLIYSTYLGGSANESPHSLIVNSQEELIVMGTTSSSNFPTTAGAFDPTFNGGPALPISGYGYSHNDGTDLFVTKFSVNGDALEGSTFVGGTGNDGLVYVDLLDFNYGDTFRGEVLIDDADNVIVASVTGSTDFPLVQPVQSTFGGGDRDACLFRLNDDLTTMLSSSFFGGSNDDAAYSVQLSSQNELFVTGGTTSTNFPMPAGGVTSSFQGVVDGYILQFSPNGGTITAGTFVGTPDHDQSYFVQLDQSDNVFVVGQSLGSYPVTTTLGQNLYTNVGSHQFIHKFSPDLSNTVWSTVFGAAANTINISLSAFLVNECDHIYVSGWGGTTNSAQVGGFTSPVGSSAAGLPTSANAFQSTTDGSDFYLMVLAEDAESLLYATYFGGDMSREHVDGGTSRFDKSGKVYQAVCAGCGGRDDFPGTAGNWSETNGSNNCNLGVFKFDLAQLTSDVDFNLPYICLPDPITFENTSNGGNRLFVEFWGWYYFNGFRTDPCIQSSRNL